MMMTVARGGSPLFNKGLFREGPWVEGWLARRAMERVLSVPEMF